jgi:hypothetical protein
MFTFRRILFPEVMYQKRRIMVLGGGPWPRQMDGFHFRSTTTKRWKRWLILVIVICHLLLRAVFPWQLLTFNRVLQKSYIKRTKAYLWLEIPSYLIINEALKLLILILCFIDFSLNPIHEVSKRCWLIKLSGLPEKETGVGYGIEWILLPIIRLHSTWVVNSLTVPMEFIRRWSEARFLMCSSWSCMFLLLFSFNFLERLKLTGALVSTSPLFKCLTRLKVSLISEYSGLDWIFSSIVGFLGPPKIWERICLSAYTY